MNGQVTLLLPATIYSVETMGSWDSYWKRAANRPRLRAWEPVLTAEGKEVERLG